MGAKSEAAPGPCRKSPAGRYTKVATRDGFGPPVIYMAVVNASAKGRLERARVR